MTIDTISLMEIRERTNYMKENTLWIKQRLINKLEEYTMRETADDLESLDGTYM